MQLVLDAFEPAFMQRALLAAVLTALCTALVGTWVVLRGMAFLGDALAHGVLPGIAIAFVVGASTTVGAVIAARIATIPPIESPAQTALSISR